jgi:hypothetical protein
MHLTPADMWTVIHGMIFGAIYLLAFAGGLSGLWGFHKWALTDEGVSERLKRLKAGVWLMVITCWLTVISGTYIIYPWYRDPDPESPRSILKSSSDTAMWHTFGMEWKEHVSWLSPLLITAVLGIVYMYGKELADERRKELLKGTIVLFLCAFFAAAVGGIFGAFLNKIAPII